MFYCQVYTGWAKSRYTVIIFFTRIVNDGRELKYEYILYTTYYILYAIYYILYT